MGETWYFIDSGKCHPAYNMAVDECLLNWHSKGEIPPVIRFYEWEPAGLSVGYFQKTTNKIDLDALKKQNIPLVRRLTGGRAVLHDKELTYSVVVSEDHPDMPHSVKDAYRVISQGLLEGFHLLGVDASFAIPEGKLETTQSAVCFEEPSWYELVIDGKKAAGSAQTRQKGVILQHGSIPITIDDDKLYDFFLYSNEKVKERAKKAFKDKAVAIQDVLSKKVTMEDTKKAFHQGFAKGLNIDFVAYDFSESQLKEIDELMKTKYMDDSWNLSR
ncbi:lipoate--protein ligase family protein [Gracilibacillus oryzae]|uniref:Lipoate--protein ligase family protein n=1 Tax=Gracilibacillus oryzae TaxID=1672701 RepID=A0A7C8KT03_9BACI|nr:biotin/lipoate A/B protein ligase family protein [Gracilibacillus oryzae]KAB8139437.1 lipoate--protein ligase family protein [Gracilibacillus oryzae]